MTDHFEPTPIPAALERDALAAGIIDSSPLGGILTDGTLHVIHVSPRAVELLGLESVTERSLPRLLGKRSRLLRPELAQSALDEALGTSGNRSLHLVESRAGEVRCLALTGSRCAGRDSRWIWWVEDVTAVAQAQQFQLLAEIGRSGSAGDASMAALAERLVDAAVNLLGVDIAVLMLGDAEGLRPASTRGVLLEDGFILRPADNPYVRKALTSQRPVVGDGSEWASNDQEMTGDHYIVPLVAAGAPVGTLHASVLNSGTVPGFDPAFLTLLSAYAGSAIANMRLFEEVRDERLRLKTVVDFIPEGVILFTGRGVVLAANEAAERIAERRWVNLNTDRRTYEILDEHGEKLRRVDWPFLRGERDGVPRIGEIVQLDFSGRRKILSISVVPVPSGRADSPPTYLGTMRDITAERQRQDEREEFLQVVSHELRSPLTPLSGFLQMVRKQAQSGEEIDADLVRRAEHQVDRLGRLIERVLDLTRIERDLDLDFETVDLRDMAKLTATLWSSDPRCAEVRVIAADAPVLVSADVDRLEQICTNLIDNAVKHSPANGVVEVHVDVDPSGRPRLQVVDEGRGIDPHEIGRIFERFYSGGHHRAGMGIGLYITAQLVEAHGGEITVESEPDVGSRFTVVLPSVSH